MNKTFESIKYKTADGKHICVEVTIEVKELLEQTDRKIRSQGRQDRRYLYRGEYIDGVTDSSMGVNHTSICSSVKRAISTIRKNFNK